MKLSRCPSKSPPSPPRSASLDAGGHVVAAAFLGATAAFALGEGEILLAGEAERRVRAHAGAILEAASDGKRLLTAGDDGKLVATGTDGGTEIARRGARQVDRSCGAWPRRRVRLVGRQDRVSPAPRRATAPLICPPALAGLLLRPRACGWRSPITTAPRSGFPTPRKPSPRCWPGRAPTATSASAPTGDFSSPPCRSRRCTAGGSPTATTCA